MIEFIDKEEKDLIESLHSTDWKSNPNKEVNKIYEEYAKHSVEFNNKIEISLSDMDLRRIQLKAMNEGIPYQSIIAMLVHKYNEGKIPLNV